MPIVTATDLLEYHCIRNGLQELTLLGNSHFRRIICNNILSRCCLDGCFWNLAVVILPTLGGLPAFFKQVGKLPIVTS